MGNEEKKVGNRCFNVIWKVVIARRSVTKRCKQQTKKSLTTFRKRVSGYALV